MVSPREIEKAQSAPTTLPADFGEWDGGDDSATQPANFNGFEAAPVSDAGRKPSAKSAAARVAVLPVAVRSSKAATRTPAASYAEAEEAFQPSQSSGVTMEGLKHGDESKGKRTKMLAGAGVLALLLAGGAVAYKLNPKLVTPNQSAVPQPTMANTPKPTAASPTTENAPTNTTVDTTETERPVRAQSDVSHQLATPSKIKNDLQSLGASQPAPTGSFSAAGMEGPGNGGGVFNGQGGPKVKVAAPQKVNISAGNAAALLIQRTPPVYPPMAKEARVSGTVVIQATISKSGSIENSHVVSGPEMLRQSALDAVRTWRFKPYMLSGEPVEVETTVNVNFALGQ